MRTDREDWRGKRGGVVGRVRRRGERVERGMKAFHTAYSTNVCYFYNMVLRSEIGRIAGSRQPPKTNICDPTNMHVTKKLLHSKCIIICEVCLVMKGVGSV